MVVFRPRTLTTLKLGSSCLAVYFNLALPPHLFLFYCFWIVRFPLFPNAPPYAAIRHRSPLVSPEPQGRPHGSQPHLPSTSLRRSSLCLDPHACICHRFPCRCSPPFVALGMPSNPSHTLGGLPVAGTSASLCPCLALPNFSSKSWHHPVSGIGVGLIFAKRREAKAPTLPGGCAPFPSTHDNYKCQRRP